MGALVLDFLLVIIFLMMVPIGFFRGGLREMCVSAGLMLGILMSMEWGSRWSNLFTRMFDMSEGSATFLMSALITFGVTGLLGYGGSSAFSYRPGPGGRLYGAFLGFFNALIVTGFLINLYGAYIQPSVDGDPITDGFVARSLSEGFHWVLLIATVGVGIATIFGMFVRDRTDEPAEWQVPAKQLYRAPEPTRPYMESSEAQSTTPRVASEPRRIVEVEEWKESEEPTRPDPSTYGSGWRQTWPDATPAQERNTRSATRRSDSRHGNAEISNTDSGKNVLADWIKDQDDN